MIQLLLPELAPGTVLKFQCSFADYQCIAAQRAESSIPRLKYRNGELLIMAPLPEHGKKADVLPDIIKTLLDHQNQLYDSYTPMTLVLPQAGGIEPDHCFYITNWKAVQGRQRIDWQIDPPPDLAVEIDVTSFSAIEDYLPYRIPEVWLLKDRLRIYQLVEGKYIKITRSSYFPNYDLQTLVADTLQIAYEQNTSAAIRQLRSTLTS